VEKVNPDLVARDEAGKPYTVRYEAVNAMLLNEFIKEHRKVEELEATVRSFRQPSKRRQRKSKRGATSLGHRPRLLVWWRMIDLWPRPRRTWPSWKRTSKAALRTYNPRHGQLRRCESNLISLKAPNATNPFGCRNNGAGVDAVRPASGNLGMGHLGQPVGSYHWDTALY
jgi:hypothetical protein